MVLSGQQVFCCYASTFSCNQAAWSLVDQHPAQLAEYIPHLIGVFFHHATRDFSSRSNVVDIVRILPGLLVIVLHRSTLNQHAAPAA